MKDKTQPGKRETEIQDLLLKFPGGLTVQEMAESLKISTVTMAKDLDVLVAKKEIYRRVIGSAKIHYHLKYARKFFQYKS